MIVSKDELAQTLRSKYHNNPGFFDGIVDVINEFFIHDFYQLYSFKEEITRFLKAYHIEGVGIDEYGEFTTTIYPFQHPHDVVLALYALGQYLK
ncbi:hypothetical protein AAFN85_11200 [Mucilaginibacter sp. CAU 1740]|uniref:hypothetical protein n=1 Tax=Mucilaginibacter sp. CAU 1740 TaxID=3140365 RepID=UPI00325A54B6